jgi:hypothetical protein
MISGPLVPIIGWQPVVPVLVLVEPAPGHDGTIRFLGRLSPDARRFREIDVTGSWLGGVSGLSGIGIDLPFRGLLSASTEGIIIKLDIKTTVVIESVINANRMIFTVLMV